MGVRGVAVVGEASWGSVVSGIASGAAGFEVTMVRIARRLVGWRVGLEGAREENVRAEGCREGRRRRADRVVRRRVGRVMAPGAPGSVWRVGGRSGVRYEGEDDPRGAENKRAAQLGGVRVLRVKYLSTLVTRVCIKYGDKLVVATGISGG